MPLQSQVSAVVYCKQRQGLSGSFPRHIHSGGKCCLLCMCKHEGKFMHWEVMNRNVHQQSRDCKQLRKCESFISHYISQRRNKEAEVKWECVSCFQLRAKWSFYNTTVCQLIIALRPSKPDQMKTATSSRLLFASLREQFSNCCFAALLCQPATLSLNDKHTVLFRVIRKTAGVSRTPH